MKELDESKFKKRDKKSEVMSFDPAPVPSKPEKEPVHMNERSNVQQPLATGYVIYIPINRRKKRQSYDAFEDQEDAFPRRRKASWCKS